MPPEELERLAREAGLIDDLCFPRPATESLRRFAALVRAQALEDAARVCDSTADSLSDQDGAIWWVEQCAAAIRALKEQP